VQQKNARSIRATGRSTGTTSRAQPQRRSRSSSASSSVVALDSSDSEVPPPPPKQEWPTYHIAYCLQKNNSVYQPCSIRILCLVWWKGRWGGGRVNEVDVRTNIWMAFT